LSFYNEKTIFIATVLAAATLVAAGLVAFPGSVQEAQANPCQYVNPNGNQDNSGNNENNVNLDCDFEGIGSLEIAESE
jgi:hypothetical protein